MALSKRSQQIIELLGTQPIAFNPGLSRLFGSVKCALLAGQLIYWHGKQADADGWIRKSDSEMSSETTLSTTEIASARERLAEYGVIETIRIGIPARLHYRINFDAMAALISDFADSNNKLSGNMITSDQETLQLVTRKHDNQSPEKNTTNTLITSMNTNNDYINEVPSLSSDGKKPVAANTNKEAFGWLKGICTGNYSPARIGKIANLLIDSGALQSQYPHFALWWRSVDFRGVKGQPPTPEQIWHAWPIAMAWDGRKSGGSVENNRTMDLYAQAYAQAEAAQ